jgi:diguanylate cyclase (GGDEF)-like protein
MTTRPRRFTLRAKLAFSFAGVGLLIAVLLAVGNEIVRDASKRMDATLSAQVRPLARLNRLQSQLSRIRVLEVELPRLSDLFAVSDQIELLRAERLAFDRGLGDFLRELPPAQRADAIGLPEHWRRYQLDLDSVARHADAMDLAAVQKVSTYESAPRFRALSRTLKQLAEATEARATAAAEEARAQHLLQQRRFALTAGVGLLLLAAWLALLARSVGGRVSRLRDAARQVAEGQGDGRIAVPGNDELTDLAAAFSAMHAKVAARERALRQAHDQLESRVDERTLELHDANTQLRREIDERKRAEAQLQQQAEVDSLTGLPNRMLAMDRLAQALLHAQRERRHVVLIFVDLDDFKKVNDTLGHPVGDALLVSAAQRLRHAVRAEDTVARHGGDEFLVILGGLASADDADPIAEKIVAAFAPSFEIGGNELVVTTSLGLAVYPEDGDEAATLLRNADMAMYDAKEAGRNTFRYFNKHVHENSVRRLAIERRLRNALQRGELRLHYQPLVTTARRDLVGAEALLRWASPDEGLTDPEHFVSVAEHTGLIVEIGEWVIATACAQLARWRSLGFTRLRVAVNVSPRQFRGDRLLRTIKQALAEYALPPQCLQLEVTESLLVRNHPEVHETLRALNALGVALAMDDFGTGYSSLSYLKRFPFDSLKIDREFVRDVGTDPEDRALVTAAIRLGKGLGLTVVAEGVEREEQLRFLAEQGCDLAQGYLFSKPLEAQAFAARWLQPMLALHDEDAADRLPLDDRRHGAAR